MNATAEMTKLVTETQERTLDALKQAQELSIRTAETAISFVPGKGADADLPTPTELVEQTFAFTSKVLDTQKKYALRLTEVLTSGAQAAAKK